jgi:hypothetical protein
MTLFSGPVTQYFPSEESFYQQLETRSKICWTFGGVAIALFVCYWIIGETLIPSKIHRSIYLIANASIIVIGITITARARQSAQTRFQTAFTWIPLVLWFLSLLQLLEQGLPTITIDGVRE